MNVLLIGCGGREHALAWRLAQSPGCTRLYAAPGNPGIAEHAELVALAPGDHRAVIDFCQRHAVGLVVIGPEAPLVDGLADALRGTDIAVFGPDKAAAQLEGSKGFTKDLCRAANIPTAGYVRVTSLAAARAALGDFGLPVVIKADGLAAGKGVTVAMSRAEAITALTDLFAGADRAEAVIEEFLDGEEVSLFVLCDGATALPFGTAQDHKRVGAGDTGPNTGGMGAYSPASILTPALEKRAMDEIVAPTLAAMAAAGTPFSGVLFAGLMLTRVGPKLIEYNVRFGDPECQVLMMRFAGDLFDLLLAVAEGRLAGRAAPTFSDQVALGVVMAARGYPAAPESGGAIGGVDAAEATGARVFQAGTRYSDGSSLGGGGNVSDGGIVAAGGRVLAVTATGSDIAAAQAQAYAAVAAIEFPGGFFRSDIGWREVARG